MLETTLTTKLAICYKNLGSHDLYLDCCLFLASQSKNLSFELSSFYADEILKTAELLEDNHRKDARHILVVEKLLLEKPLSDIAKITATLSIFGKLVKDICFDEVVLTLKAGSGKFIQLETANISLKTGKSSVTLVASVIIV